MAYLVVTPGYTFTANEPLTYAKLNLLGQPVVSLTTDLFNILTAFKNGFINGNLQVWQRGTTAKSCPAATKTWRADRWFARPVGAAITYAQSATVPSGAIATYSALLTGAASVTTVDFGQRIESTDAISNWQRERTFSATSTTIPAAPSPPSCGSIRRAWPITTPPIPTTLTPRSKPAHPARGRR